MKDQLEKLFLELMYKILNKKENKGIVGIEIIAIHKDNHIGGTYYSAKEVKKVGRKIKNGK